ncbi:MAG: A/G-specific adenine glycosylase [Crocinitomicaceae bacterium]|nr:A/G-specific adenine glycosylase [Crocinitomicaceae bacterium]
MTNFHLLIIEWYRQNARNLPWRNTENPYFIWLSEIILQQTRVQQGMNYYLKFVNRFPTVDLLADADEQEVLALWQGLGYYSRARNLHATAKIISKQYNNVFPSSYKNILSLKGVGSYTASAIASFAFDLSHAVVDGNVYRVISRYLDIEVPIDTSAGKKMFEALAAELLGDNPPAIHNQAIMEFGALQCVPVNPNCGICPLAEQCLALQRNTVAQRPIKSTKIKTRNRYFHFALFENAGKIIIQKRIEKDIWQHLFQLPLLETEVALETDEIERILFENYQIKPISVSEPIKHILSHQKIHARVWKFEALPDQKLFQENWEVISFSDLIDYPIPKLLDRYFQG